MNKCPNCNNNLSSSDVLCPKCGAMVEQINTQVSVNNKSPETSISAPSESTDFPNYEDSIIMYNESFPVLDGPEPPEPPGKSPLEEDDLEDFDIEKACGLDHKNPLLAHIEKQRHTLKQDSQSQDNADDDYFVENENEDLAAEPEEAIDFSDTDYYENEEVIEEDEPLSSLEEEFENSFEESEPASSFEEEFENTAEEDEAAISLEEEFENSFEESEKSSSFEEEFDNSYEENDTVDSFWEEDPANAYQEDAETSATSELEQITNNNLADEPKAKHTDGFPLDGIPAYSKEYLDAIRNVEISDEELEAEEEFDPDAFMEKFKQENLKKQEQQSQDEINKEQPVTEEEPEEPVRRRYNPNKPKPNYNEEELLKEAQEKLLQEKLIQEKAKQLAEQEAERAKAEQETEKAQEKSEEKSGKKAEQGKDEDLLELELDPNRFFITQPEESESDHDEHFLFDEDEDIKPNPEDKKPVVKYEYEGLNEEKSLSSDIMDDPLEENVLKKNRSKRLPVWAAALIWLAVAGGIFFGTYLLDKHIRKTYQTYNNFIYEITDGKIDIASLTE